MAHLLREVAEVACCRPMVWCLRHEPLTRRALRATLSHKGRGQRIRALATVVNVRKRKDAQKSIELDPGPHVRVAVYSALSIHHDLHAVAHLHLGVRAKAVEHAETFHRVIDAGHAVRQ